MKITGKMIVLFASLFAIAIVFVSHAAVWADNTDTTSVAQTDSETSVKVTFYSDGSELETRTVDLNGQLGSMPEVPVKDGYTFYGWCTSDGDYNTLSLITAETKVNKDIAYYSYFTKNLTVTFMVNGNVFASYQIPSDPVTGENTEVLTLPQDEPVKEGRIFRGWFLENGQQFSQFIKTTTDVVYNAEFQELATVTFYVNGNAYEKQTFDKGSSYYRPSEPETPEIEGYIFEGWYKDSEFTTKANFQVENLRTDTDYYGKFIEKSERIGTITFDLEGQVYEEQFFGLGTGLYTVTEPQPPKYEGYLFGGWFKDREYTDPLTFPVNVMESATYYGRFVEPGTVTFMVNDIVLEQQQFPLNGLDYSPADPATAEYEGYVFEGWYTDEEFTKKAKFPLKVTESTTFYAKYVEIGTVTFYMDEDEYLKNEFLLSTVYTVNEPEIPVKEGSVFEGWYTDETFKQQVRFPVQISNSVSYYAKFSEGKLPVTITFMIDNEVFETQELNIGQTIPGNTKVIPADAGNIFDGWYTDEACTAHAVFPVTASADTVYYGKMCAIGSIRFIVDGEEFTIQNFLLNGAAFTVKAPMDPEKEGASFVGWFLDEKFKTPVQFPMQTTESFTCYAKFSSSGMLTGTSFGYGQLAFIAGIIAIAAGAVFFITRRNKHRNASEK